MASNTTSNSFEAFLGQLKAVCLSSAYESAFNHIQEIPDGYWVDRIDGVIPAELNGTYFKSVSACQKRD